MIALRLGLGLDFVLLPLRLALGLSFCFLRLGAFRRGCSSEDSGISSLQLLQHLWSVLCVHQVLRLRFDLFEDVLFERPVQLGINGPLQDVVAVLVSRELVDNHVSASDLNA